jgi:hypothetical protein
VFYGTKRSQPSKVMKLIAGVLASPEPREPAGVVLRPPGPLTPEAVEALIRDLRHSPSATTRWWAALDIGNLIPPAAQAVPSLAAALQDDRCPFVRLAAAEALGAIGPAALPAAPALKEALQFARLLAAEIEGALQRIIPGAHVAAPAEPSPEEELP